MHVLLRFIAPFMNSTALCSQLVLFLYYKPYLNSAIDIGGKVGNLLGGTMTTFYDVLLIC